MKPVYTSAGAFLNETLKQKRDRRHKLATLPLGEKIALIEKMRLDLEPIRHARTVGEPSAAQTEGGRHETPK
jgi:hypothetical protein